MTECATSCRLAGSTPSARGPSFVERGDEAAELVRPEILRSWELLGGRDHPRRHRGAARRRGRHRGVLARLAAADRRGAGGGRAGRTAEDGDLVIAVTDAETRILWTYGGRVMRRKAETVNFVPGGRWDEASVGTNALAISNRTGDPSMVFSAEHYASIVHNWVCWAAPLHDPVTGEQIGVIDLSTTWDRTHPIGLATARVMARLIETAMPRSRHWAPCAPSRRPTTSPGLSLSLLGTAEAWLDGQRLLLNRRQTEILALLAMHPEGLSLEHLHALVYGDQAVTLSTLKAEVSHLRSALGGQLASRPYRLPLPVRHRRRRRSSPPLRRGQVRAAVAAYDGDLLPGTNSPALVELAVRPSRSARRCWPIPDPDAVLRYAERRRTTPRSSRSAPPPSAREPTRSSRCSRAGWPPRASRPPRWSRPPPILPRA